VNGPGWNCRSDSWRVPFHGVSHKPRGDVGVPSVNEVGLFPKAFKFHSLPRLE